MAVEVLAAPRPRRFARESGVSWLDHLLPEAIATVGDAQGDRPAEAL